MTLNTIFSQKDKIGKNLLKKIKEKEKEKLTKKNKQINA